MNKNVTYSYSWLLIGIAGGMMLASCDGEEWTAADVVPSTQGEAEMRPLVEHEVSVTLDDATEAGNGASTRVNYTPSGDGLQLTWEASETLGVYIKNGSAYTYAGTVTSNGSAGDRSTRRFSGTISAKNEGEKYVYVHPAPTGESQGSPATGTINFTSQTGSLSSTDHLCSYIPLVWQEGDLYATHHGYAVHLTLSFHEDPGTITSVALQTMPEVGTDKIFPETFNASTMSASSTDPYVAKDLTLTVTSGTATKSGNMWYADAYLASSNIAADVFRTKYNVKVVANNGTFYNEFRSFPGQESASSTTLQMLANGKCYNLMAPMSKGVATTLINSQYKVNSLLGMWNDYGKPTDPLGLIVYAGGEASLPADGIMPAQLKANKDAILQKYLSQKATNGTPTWLGPASGSIYATSQADLKQSDVTINNIEITQPTEVFVTFISEFGWNENLLGYYYYPAGSEPTSGSVTKTIIFPNVSKPNHQPFNLGGSGTGSTTTPVNIGTPAQAPLREYETVKLLYTDASGFTSTTFPVGTTIGFMMMIDTEAQENSPKSGYDLLKWSQWRLFTNTKWNAENSNWLNTYANDNFFASGDVCNGSGNPIPGLAIYGVKDNATNNASTAYGAMIFMVSTKEPAAMQTHNKAYFNIGSGDLVIAK